MTDQVNPFRVGDQVVFTPDQRTVGWYQHSFERWGIYPGYVGRVTQVVNDKIELDGNPESTMYWSQFQLASEVSTAEREAMVSEYKRRIK